MTRTRLFIHLGLIAFACLFLPPPQFLLAGHHEGCKHVLFIGNSLTFMHDIPGLTEKISAQMVPDHPLCVVQRAVPGVTLDWHLRDRKSRELLFRRGWDYVVVQEQSGRAYQEPAAMQNSLTSIVSEIRKLGAEPLIYSFRSMTYPEYMSVALHERMNRISKALSVRLVPVDDLYADLHKQKPLLPVFEKDGHHPGSFGALAAAMLFTRCISGKLVTPADFALNESPTFIFQLITGSPRVNLSQDEVETALSAVERASSGCLLSPVKEKPGLEKF